MTAVVALANYSDVCGQWSACWVVGLQALKMTNQ